MFYNTHDKEFNKNLSDRSVSSYIKKIQNKSVDELISDLKMYANALELYSPSKKFEGTVLSSAAIKANKDISIDILGSILAVLASNDRSLDKKQVSELRELIKPLTKYFPDHIMKLQQKMLGVEKNSDDDATTLHASRQHMGL